MSKKKRAVVTCSASQRVLSDGDLASVASYGARGYEIIVECWSVFQDTHISLADARTLLHGASDALLKKYRDRRWRLNDAPRLGPDAPWTEKQAEWARMSRDRNRLSAEFVAAASKRKKTCTS